MKTIISIDMNIIMSPSLPLYYRDVREFSLIEQFIENNQYIEYAPADLTIYAKLTNELLIPYMKMLPKEKIHFVYGQEDTLHYLTEPSTVMNIDFNSDVNEYVDRLYNDNWISYGFDTNKINDVIWISAVNSIKDIRNYNIDNSLTVSNCSIDLLPDADEIVISLSEEWILPQYKPLINLWQDLFYHYYGEYPIIEEYQDERELSNKI